MVKNAHGAIWNAHGSAVVLPVALWNFLTAAHLQKPNGKRRLAARTPKPGGILAGKNHKSNTGKFIASGEILDSIGEHTFSQGVWQRVFFVE